MIEMELIAIENSHFILFSPLIINNNCTFNVQVVDVISNKQIKWLTFELA